MQKLGLWLHIQIFCVLLLSLFCIPDSGKVPLLDVLTPPQKTTDFPISPMFTGFCKKSWLPVLLLPQHLRVVNANRIQNQSDGIFFSLLISGWWWVSVSCNVCMLPLIIPLLNFLRYICWIQRQKAGRSTFSRGWATVAICRSLCELQIEQRSSALPPTQKKLKK